MVGRRGAERGATGSFPDNGRSLKTVGAKSVSREVVPHVPRS